MSESGYYPTLADKASYLCVNIISGHNFSNGNKRLGIMTLLVFLAKNKKKRIKEFSMEEMMNLLFELFGEKIVQNILKEQNEDPDNWKPSLSLAYFIIPIIIADKEKYSLSFDVLKSKVATFLKRVYGID